MDLEWCRRLSQQGGYYLACFLAQQSAEKALKGFLYAQGMEVVLGHSVRRLCQQASSYDPLFAQYVEGWSTLDTYYIPTRYPNGLPDDIPGRVYNEHMAVGAIALAAEAVTQVRAWFDRNE